MQTPDEAGLTALRLDRLTIPRRDRSVQLRQATTRVKAYVALTKPRIVELLLITTVPTMFVAERGLPPIRLITLTVLGGALAAGGANAMNMVYDRDIDALMERTKHRPLVTGLISPRAAVVFAALLEMAAFALLASTVNLLSAILAVSATAFYVGVYTMWLKRSSPQNIVIGGAAGAVPVLVGWSAVTGRLSLAPFLMFGLIFLWTPPHFWALAVRYREDYTAARVPMLPSVADMTKVTREILCYTVGLVVLSLVLVPVAHLGLVYAAVATVSGAAFLRYAVALVRDPRPGSRDEDVRVLDHVPHGAVLRDGNRCDHPSMVRPQRRLARPMTDTTEPPADGHAPRAEVDRAAAFAAGPSRIPRRFVYIVLCAAAVLAIGGALAEHIVSAAGLNPTPTTTTPARPTRPVSATSTEHEALVPGALGSFMGLERLTPGGARGFSLVDERGQTISLAGARGKVVVLTFFNGRCNDICPVLAREIRSRGRRPRRIGREGELPHRQYRPRGDGGGGTANGGRYWPRAPAQLAHADRTPRRAEFGLAGLRHYRQLQPHHAHGGAQRCHVLPRR